jgi:hypothetical protein
MTSLITACRSNGGSLSRYVQDDADDAEADDDDDDDNVVVVVVVYKELELYHINILQI